MYLITLTEDLKSNTGDVFTNRLEYFIEIYNKLKSNGHDVTPEMAYFIFHFELECKNRNIEI